MIALAFVCFGMALGVFLDRLYLHYSTQNSIEKTRYQDKPITLDMLVGFFGEQLQLSPKQTKKVNHLIRSFLRKGLLLFKNRPPEVTNFLRKGNRLRDGFRASVRSVLTPKQKILFNRMIDKLDKQRFDLQFMRLRFQQEILKGSP
ncbi:MAG: hypothetical protein EP343_03005 [Deltaproteobacteria bacterium]|nr:MAG: hypothetical protein EP343_03005 [Deltaproteobacteria bacterium]